MRDKYIRTLIARSLVYILMIAASSFSFSICIFPTESATTEAPWAMLKLICRDTGSQVTFQRSYVFGTTKIENTEKQTTVLLCTNDIRELY